MHFYFLLVVSYLTIWFFIILHLILVITHKWQCNELLYQILSLFWWWAVVVLWLNCKKTLFFYSSLYFSVLSVPAGVCFITTDCITTFWTISQSALTIICFTALFLQLCVNVTLLENESELKFCLKCKNILFHYETLAGQIRQSR